MKYRLVSLNESVGAFLSTAGIEDLFRAHTNQISVLEPDKEAFDKALKFIAREATPRKSIKTGQYHAQLFTTEEGDNFARVRCPELGFTFIALSQPAKHTLRKVLVTKDNAHLETYGCT